ncbi:MAG: ATP-binding protein [Candidatus Heimdallarchaeota archaeon]|nr:ATP-binding protein [Candidatus Heimdallarchaeota archaeon]
MYKDITYMSKKDKLSEEDIKKKVQSRIKYIEDLDDRNEDEDDDYRIDYFFKLFESDNKQADLYDISLLNFNYTSKCTYSDFDPADYSQNKDSTTGYYQLDFTASAINLDRIEELVDANQKYYTTIYDLIFDKFGRDFRSKDSNLKHKVLFIFPKEHIGKVELELKGKQLKIKTINMNSDELTLKIQIKKYEPLSINHYEINLKKDIEEHEIKLEFIPEIINGYLLDVYEDGNICKRIQKIVRKFDKIISDKIDEKALQNIILEGEGLSSDFKELYPHKDGDIKKLKHKKIDREICSFANAKGGFLIFGVDDDGNIKGYKITNQFKNFGSFDDNIQRICNKEIEPPVTAHCFELEIGKKKLSIVQVSPNYDFWVRLAKSKTIIVRKGSTARDAVPNDLKKYQKKDLSN